MIQSISSRNRWYTNTIQQLFKENCEAFPDKPALVFENKAITFERVQHNANKISQALLLLGIKKGDHVAILPTACPEFTYIYLATLQIGALINPLNLLWGSIELSGVLKRNAPKIIFTIDKNAGRNYIKLLCDSIPDLRFNKNYVSSKAIPSLIYLVSHSRTNATYEGFINLKDLLKTVDKYDSELIGRIVSEGKCTDIQFMCQTSGSTGLSKSALWDHRPPLATAFFAVKNMLINNDDSYINLTPFYHCSGICALNISLAIAGITLYLIENFDPEAALKLIDKYKITSTFGFDAHWQAFKNAKSKMANEINFNINKAMGAITSKTRTLILEDLCGGKDIILLNLYAQTENGPLVTLGEPDCMNSDLNLNTNGRPLPGIEITIKDINNGEKLMHDRQGEICYKSPFHFRGYYNQDEETKKLFDDEGYFRSGDYGTFSEGYLKFYGRLGGVVKSGGENVSTTYVSILLQKQFPLEFEDVLTIDLPDDYWGKKIVSVIRLKSGVKFRGTKALRNDCKGMLAEYEIPKAFVEWTEEWPMTAEGKVNIKELRAKVLAIIADKDGSMNNVKI